jgi:uncharacterized protein YbjT (DUF2867 family)
MRSALLAVLLLFGLTASAAEESTEPPPPKASPVISVMEESLPRAGGVIVFGGTRGLGLAVVRELVAKKLQVTVMARASSDTAAVKALGAEVVEGDALDPEAVKKAFTAAPFRAVISTLGGHDGDYRVDSQGNKNVIDVTKKAGLERIILVTALGAGDSNAGAPWYVKFFMDDYFKAKTEAENHLTASDLNYTIIRPGVLLEEGTPGEPKYVPTAEGMTGILRSELAKLVAGTIDDSGSFKKTFAAIDAKRMGVWALLTY